MTARAMAYPLPRGAPCESCGLPILTAPSPYDRTRRYCRRVACRRERSRINCRTYRAAHLDAERARSRTWAAANPDKARRWAREHPEANRLSAHRAYVKYRARYGERNNARLRAARLAAGAIPRRHASRSSATLQSN